MKQVKLKVFLGVLLVAIIAVTLGHFMPAWAAQPIVVNPIPNQNVVENGTFDFSFAAHTFSDPDQGDSLTYIAQIPGGTPLPAWLNFNSATRTFSGTPSNGDVGTITVEVIASDGGSFVSDFFDIEIYSIDYEGSMPPTIINPIPNQSATEDTAFNFQFASNTFYDVDFGATLTYSTQLAGGGSLPSWLNFNSATRTFSGTPTNADVGTLTIEVIASDGNGGTVTDEFNIVISNVNDAPTVANPIPNQNTTEDTAFNFQFASNTFNDADVGDNLTYSAQLAGGGLLPTWLSFDALTRTFSGTPSNSDVGTISIDVIADDSNGGTVTDTFDIVVAEASEDPSVTLPPTMIAPASNTTYGLIPVNYELGENPLTGTVRLIFTGDATITITLNIGDPVTGPYQYSINPKNILATGVPITSVSQNSIPNGTYTVTLSYQNNNGDPAANAIATNVTVDSALIDTDSDGSLDSVEEAGPNSGDANGDGTTDSEQPNVYSYVNPLTTNYAVFETDCERVENFQIGSESSEQPDVEYDYPMGLASFWIHCENAGDTAQIRHYYYGIEGSELYSVRKWMNDGTYREIPGYQPLGALIGEEVVFMTQYEITDGSGFDDDGNQDAVVRDPSGAALRVAGGGVLTDSNTDNVNESTSSSLAGTGLNLVVVLIVSFTLFSAAGTATHMYRKQN